MAKTTKTKKTQRDIEAIKHEQSSRRNIPSEQTRGFLNEEDRGDLRCAFALHPSADPQLLWSGKSLEAEKLWADAPVIYKQENISPQMVIEGLRATLAEDSDNKGGELGKTTSMFEGDFDGLGDREKVDFYRHDHSWQNRMIFGDSLSVMASLLEREAMREQVQCVYIDPPYGIKFGSNWQVSTRRRDVKDTQEGMTAEPEAVKAFRDTWNLGIHSYLEYWRDRFLVARELLKETGSIFVQIGDQNVHLIRNLLDEIFGAENFNSQIVFRKSSPLGSKKLTGVVDYILWYFKDANNAKIRNLFTPKDFGEGSHFNMTMDKERNKILMTQEQLKDKDILKKYIVFSSEKLSSAGYTTSCMFDFKFQGNLYKCGAKSWRTTESGIERLIKADRIIASGTIPRFTPYFTDFPVKILNSLWVDTYGANDPIYIVQTTNSVIQRCLLMATDPGDLVLDPTCGSGTTAYVAEQWARRWITCDTSRVALALARTRIMSATYPHYQLKNPRNTTEGFHYNTAPHITLKDIANNESIDALWEEYEVNLQPLRVKLGFQEDWQVPKEESSPDLITYNRLRRARQAAIDAAIRANASFETLYDQPLEDKSIVRVAGPFTVESLLPFKLPASKSTSTASKSTSTTASLEDTSTAEQNARNDDRYTKTLIEQLLKAGVENRRKKDRLTFSRLEETSDALLAAVGYFLDEQGAEKTAAIAFGPQYSTLNESFLREAAQKAAHSFPNHPKGFELLILCGFAFAPDLHEEIQRYGKLKVLFAKMDATLADTEQHLQSQKGKSDNLFMVWGEPDIDLSPAENPELLVVSIKGVDVFNPITNEVTSCSPNEIACWFIDTDYTGECFFVRHAYFTGEKNPYKQLQKALNSNISLEAWESLNSNTSRPFAKPASGRIAVKVINHYGDEVTKTFKVA